MLFTSRIRTNCHARARSVAQVRSRCREPACTTSSSCVEQVRRQRCSLLKEIDHRHTIWKKVRRDCLYLSARCIRSAKRPISTLVTADRHRRFANEVGDAFGRVDVRYIGEERFARLASWSLASCQPPRRVRVVASTVRVVFVPRQVSWPIRRAVHRIVV